MGPERTSMTIDERMVDGHRVLALSGRLDARTYRTIRDRIVKAALDEPRSVIVDVNALEVPASSAWSVFTAAHWLVAEWPGVPVALVCGDEDRAGHLSKSGVCRYLPAYRSVEIAIQVMPPERRRLRVRLNVPASPGSAGTARKFVALWLTRWDRAEMIAVAKVVVTELVENVLEHTDSEPRIRLETDGSLITIAVEDDNPEQAALRETSPGETSMGLHVVDAFSMVWRNAPTSTGKVVWAAIGPENRL